MANVLVNESSLTAIGNAIRQKKSETTKYKPSEMAPAILTIDGSSKPTIDDSTLVAFFDYDGELLETWNETETLSKTTLPTPSITHEGLLFEGWNWTLEEIQNFGTEQLIVVGALYTTESGLTEYVVRMNKAEGMTFKVEDFNHDPFTVNWGDGITETISSTTFSHTYAAEGIYTIKLTGDELISTSSENNFANAISHIIEIHYSQYSHYNLKLWSYVNLEKVSVSSAVDVGTTSTTPANFSIRNTQLKFITIPGTTEGNTISIGWYNGNYNGEYGGVVYNKKLIAISLPPNRVQFNNVGAYNFYNNSKLEYLTIPSSVTLIPQWCFFNDESLKLKIPSWITTVEPKAFRYCKLSDSLNVSFDIGDNSFSGAGIKEITFPENITSIPNACFSSTSLTSLKIPSYITSIGSQVFQDCCDISVVEVEGTENMTIGDRAFETNEYRSDYELKRDFTSFDFTKSTGVPTITSTTFGQKGRYNDETAFVKKILVPSSLYGKWINTDNWTIVADKIEPVGTDFLYTEGDTLSLYNKTLTIVVYYQSDTAPTDITIAASNPDAVVIGDYTLNETTKTITFTVTTQSITDTAVITIGATLDGTKKEITHSIRIKEVYKTPSFTVEDVEGASYNFVLNDDGYYENTNQTVGYTAALCKVNITDLEDSTKVIFDYLQKGDYGSFGIISKLDKDLSTTKDIDDASLYYSNLQGISTTTVKSVKIPVKDIESGYFIVKFRTAYMSSGESYNMQFKVRFE